MTDIVETLDRTAEWLASCNYNASALNVKAAAREIERLRADSGDGPYYKALYEEAEAENAKLRADLAQRGEPVAYMMVNKTHDHPPSLHWKAPADWHITWEAVPLYTAPPQRKPLTDEQIDAITKERWGSQLLGVMVAAHREYARAIEHTIMGGDDGTI